MTSFKWFAYYPKDISGAEGRIYSDRDFELFDGSTKATFAIYVDKDEDAGFEDYVVGVEMKSNPEGKRLKLDVQVWLENYEGVSSNRYEKKNCTFFKVGDTCGFELGRGTASTIFSRAMQNDACLYFCCKLTDKTSEKSKPTPETNDRYRQNLWKAYEKGIGLDTTIKLDSGKEFKVAGLLLMSQSPVFQTMFKEEYVEGQTKTAKIEEVDDDVMEAFINWLYLGEVDMEKFAENLLIFADRYQVAILKDQCLDFMAEDIYIDNVCKYSNLAAKYDSDELKEAAMEFISKMSPENAAGLFASEEWTNLASNNQELANTLKDQHCQAMIDDFCTENICKYLTSAFDYDDDKLKTAAIEFVSELDSEEVNELLVSEEWVEFAMKHEDPAEEIYGKMIKRAKLQ